MRNIIPSVAALALLGACAVPGMPPREARNIAEAQAALATDPAQAVLWEKAAAGGATVGIEKVTTERPAVTPRKLVLVSSRPAAMEKISFPQTLRTAVSISVPAELEDQFTGRARVRSAEGEFVEFEIGGQRTLRLQSKLDGVPLRARTGETADVLLRVGDIYERNDILFVRVAEDELLHALVGADGPVSFAVKERGLVAEQTGEPDGNTMPVRVSFGGETHTLRAGEQAEFGETQMTLRILASVAVQGQAANALEGEPYRIELVAWRSRL